ncbi:Hypp2528 [Branchiostoma lanceolatum]|uniref:Hypp2528 protein n=1 Tax=Branchiostoma lanceolatum TaxID=7740 RepID=A0A8J9ZRJ0_BRALA|nr:Hypp2528 [Branchiostoma lanceolatum]
MADDKWHWMKNSPPKNARKGFFSSLADAVRGKGPSPDKASRLVTRFSKAYAIGAWTLCVAAGLHWYYHRKDEQSVSSSSHIEPDHKWDKKTPVGTFSFEGFKPSDDNPNKLRIYKRKVKAKLEEWWESWTSNADVDNKPADDDKGTT